MEKKKTGMGSVYAIMGLFLLVVIGGVIFLNMKNNLSGGGVVEICDGHMISGTEAWGNFLVKSKAGKSARIKFKFSSDVGGNSSSAILKYSNGKYTYKDKNGLKHTDSHILDISGMDPQTETLARYICLADQDYTFDQVVTGEAKEGKTSAPYVILISLRPDAVVPK